MTLAIDNLNTSPWTEIPAGTLMCKTAHTSISRSTRRGRTYRRVPVKVAYSGPGIGHGELKPGAFAVVTDDGTRSTARVARYIGHIHADADGPTVPEFTGFAFLVMGDTGVYERWFKTSDHVAEILSDSVVSAFRAMFCAESL